MLDQKTELKNSLLPLQAEQIVIQDKLLEADTLDEISELKQQLSEKNDEILEAIQASWRKRVSKELYDKVKNFLYE